MILLFLSNILQEKQYLQVEGELFVEKLSQTLTKA